MQNPDAPLTNEEIEVIGNSFEHLAVAVQESIGDPAAARDAFRAACLEMAPFAAEFESDRAEALRGQLLETRTQWASAVAALQRLIANPIDEDARAAARGVLAWVNGGRT